jgi:hypothetical protein
VAKMKDLLDEVASQDTDHPYLLILHESNWSLVESISSQSLRECALHLVYIGLV